MRTYVDSGDIRSRGGICRESPRNVKAGRRGVVGLSKDVSSLDRFSGSRKFGDGDKMGSLPSDKDLPLDGDLDACLLSTFTSPDCLLSGTSSPVVSLH